MTEIEKPKIYPALDAVMSGKYTIEKRMALSAQMQKRRNFFCGQRDCRWETGFWKNGDDECLGRR